MNPEQATPMSGEQKLAFVEAQISAGSTDMLCPYCGAHNAFGSQSLCCGTFADAVNAVLDRISTRQQKQQFERIAEQIDKRPVVIQ